MACGRILGSLDAFQRITLLSTSTAQFFPVTDWVPATGLQVRAWLNVLDESGGGVSIRPAVQYAQVVTDQPAANGGRGDWAGQGTAVTTEGIHAFGDLSLSTDKQWVRFGFEATLESGSLGQADVSAMFQLKPCGRVVGQVNVAGLEADATREIPVSDWFETVDASAVRIAHLLDADSDFKIDWYIQTANDTNRPGQPATLSQTQVSGSGAGTYVVGNTGNISITSTTTPGTVTNTPVWCRIMARLSTAAAGPVTADQLVVIVQVS